MKKELKKDETLLFSILVLLLPLLVNFIIPKIIIAQEDSNDKAIEIREAVEKRVQGTVKKFSEEKIGISGNLIKTTCNTLTLESDTKEYLVNIATDATIINTKRKSTTIEDLELEKPILALGYSDSNGQILAKRIVQVEKLNKTEKEVIFGVVSDLSRDEKILTIKNELKKETYLVDAKNVLKITKNGKDDIEPAVYTEIEQNTKIIAIGSLAQNGQKSLKAIKIHILSSSD
jgi:RNase P/RNase MRP subunit p29